jgi:hypothetical protein
MQRHGVRRLVVTSMLGAGDSEANASIFLRPAAGDISACCR